MSIPRPRPGDDGGGAAVGRLLAGLVAEPLGQVSASIYETARMIVLAPWLRGHADRVAFLLGSRRADGGWGGPAGYGLVPTLSAVDALLDAARTWAKRSPSSVAYDSIVASANEGLRAVFGWLDRDDRLSPPDMPAIELIVPALTTSINRHLDELSHAPRPGLAGFVGTARLSLPAAMTADPVDIIRNRLRSGHAVAEKLHHALEIAGVDAVRARGIRPDSSGCVGASPAATAAWLGPAPPPADDPSRVWLEAVVARSGGPVPCGLPITVFERAWVVAGLSRNGVSASVPGELLFSLDDALGAQGAAGGAGLPTDADSTSVALFALARHGMSRRPACLRRFEGATHFHTWPGEQGASTSVNAHVLEALGGSADVHNEVTTMPAFNVSKAIDKVTAWLCERQEPDGRWTDRWHASPHYATACCVVALSRFARRRAEHAVNRALIKAADWVLDSQRDDGSWGEWGGTAEETAYAVQAALAVARGEERTEIGERADRAAARAFEFLSASSDAASSDAASSDAASSDPVAAVPMWHDKDLYNPTAVVRAEVFGAMTRARAAHARVAARRTCQA